MPTCNPCRVKLKHDLSFNPDMNSITLPSL